MNRFLWLVGLPIIGAIVSFIISFINQRQIILQTHSLAAQPSTIVTVEDDSSSKSDRLKLPPSRQTFTAGDYRLVILAEDNWETPLTQAELFKDGSALWQKALPHQYGPRFVLISTHGNVLLLDEFINVASPHAITLIDTKGQTIVQHSFTAIQTKLHLSAADLIKQATTGWWISAAPTLIKLKNCATVSTGGTLLAIDLVTGAIGPHDSSSL